MPEAQKTALLIAGPTASGKSALARRLAAERNGVVINADSMQVYRELRILSARPSDAEEAEVPHRLYGHVSGADTYSVGHWLDDAETEITRCWEQGQLPIICGGTGLYFLALTRGIAEIPRIPQEAKEKWRSFAGSLHDALSQRDPASAARLHPSDRQRLIRALEVFDVTGQTLTDWHKAAESRAPLRDVSLERLFLDVERDVLYARAEYRFDLMMEQGALEEVQRLPAIPASQPVMKAIGVPELQGFLRQQMTLEKAMTDAKTATRNYIKRQLTWWRGQMSDWQSVKPD
jgi:tRNA dimethylallyltransferase